MTKPADPAETGRQIGRIVGHEFTSTDALVRALTHSSAEGATDGNYERLEFLGDRVLGLVVAEMLHAEFPDADQGELSRRFNMLVSRESCAEVAEEIGLGTFIVTGTEIKSLKGRKRQNLRADVIESVIAAIYLDGGLDAARRFIERHWRRRAHATDAGRRDPKTELQEWAHRLGRPAPLYETENRAGPDHDPVFTVKAVVEGHAPEQGKGRSKREAEQAAATALLVREGVWAGERR
ncbi:MAG: ribonuclease III [Rhizobiaceae bacterium]